VPTLSPASGGQGECGSGASPRLCRSSHSREFGWQSPSNLPKGTSTRQASSCRRSRNLTAPGSLLAQTLVVGRCREPFPEDLHLGPAPCGGGRNHAAAATDLPVELEHGDQCFSHNSRATTVSVRWPRHALLAGRMDLTLHRRLDGSWGFDAMLCNSRASRKICLDSCSLMSGSAGHHRRYNGQNPPRPYFVGCGRRVLSRGCLTVGSRATAPATSRGAAVHRCPAPPESPRFRTPARRGGASARASR